MDSDQAKTVQLHCTRLKSDTQHQAQYYFKKILTSCFSSSCRSGEAGTKDLQRDQSEKIDHNEAMQSWNRDPFPWRERMLAQKESTTFSKGRVRLLLLL